MNYSIMIINRQKIDAAVATLSSAWELNVLWIDFSFRRGNGCSRNNITNARS